MPSLITKLLSLITEYKSQVRLLNIHKHTQMLLFATHSGDIEEMKKEIEQGANINDLQPIGTPLMMAIIYKQHAAAQLLIELGANPYFENDREQNGFDIAVALKDTKSHDLIVTAMISWQLATGFKLDEGLKKFLSSERYDKALATKHLESRI